MLGSGRWWIGWAAVGLPKLSSADRAAERGLLRKGPVDPSDWGRPAAEKSASIGGQWVVMGSNGQQRPGPTAER
jgi:hypothetical protein